MFKKNPYTWHASAASIKSNVLDVIVKSANKTVVHQFVRKPVDLFLPHGPPRSPYRTHPAQFFVKPSLHSRDTKNIQYHKVFIPLGYSAAFVRVKPVGSRTLRIHIGSLVTIVPKDLSSCADGTGSNADSPDCNLDPFTVRIPISDRSDAYRIGVQFLSRRQTPADALRKSMVASQRDGHRSRRNCGSNPQLDNDLCVKVKSPPTRPPRVIIPHYNRTTDVNYTFSVQIGSCMYWRPDENRWTDDGCKVNGLTCL